MIEIIRLREDSIDDQVQLYLNTFNQGGSFATEKARWEKKHYNNPIEQSTIFAAVDDGTIVGLNAFLPCNYRYNNRTIQAIQSCDSAVLNEYRGQGIWSSIMRSAMKYFMDNSQKDIIIGFPNYKNSYQGFLKLGWKHVCNMNNYLMVTNGDLVTDSIVHNKTIGKVLNIQNFLVRKKTTSSNGFYVVNNTSNKYSLVNDYHGTITLNSTDNIINWKKDYNCLEERTVFYNEKKVAVFYGKINNYNTIPYYELHRGINISNNPYMFKCSFYSFVQEIINEHIMAFIRIWENEASDTCKQLRNAFFYKAHHKNPFIVYPLKKGQVDYFDKNKWTLSLLDLD